LFCVLAEMCMCGEIVSLEDSISLVFLLLLSLEMYKESFLAHLQGLVVFSCE
jgi:DTW domain-containing protein YfiP